MGGALLQHTPHLSSTPPSPLVLFLLFSNICEQGKSYQGELGSLEERIFGMNTMKKSSKVLLLFYPYISAIELEYSFHVLIMTYELAYSFYAMSLTCKTLSLNIHITCMITSRAELRWRFIIPSGLPMSYACRSVGSESRGGMGSFFVHGRGARVHGNLRI